MRSSTTGDESSTTGNEGDAGDAEDGDQWRSELSRAQLVVFAWSRGTACDEFGRAEAALRRTRSRGGGSTPSEKAVA